MAYQENISVDSIIEKCLNKGETHSDIADMLNMIFGNINYTVKHVEDRVEQIKVDQKQLEYLKTLPRIEQRTPEWYEARNTLITASDFGQSIGLGKFGSAKDIIKKKVGYEDTPFNNNAPPLVWGCCYEEVACAIYEKRNFTHVNDFGLLRHPNIDFLGASPDGISDQGIMLEIKCPYARKIDGTVPEQYYIQIQGQLDVCNLTHCDYFEIELKESTDIDDILSIGHDEKGAIIELPDRKYIYSPIFGPADKQKILDWTSTESAKYTDSDIIKIAYHTPIKTHQRRIYKDMAFLEEKYEKLAKVWENIQEYRRNEELYNKEIRSAPKASYGTPKLQGYAFK
jgi:putative phage-type endonuclease